MNLTYRACKSIIDRKAYVSKEDMLFKLDIFLLNDRIDQLQYDELSNQLNEQ